MTAASTTLGGAGHPYFDATKAYALGNTVRSAVDQRLYIRRANAGTIIATDPQADYTNWLQDGFPASTKSLQAPVTLGGPTTSQQAFNVLQIATAKGGGVYNQPTWAAAANTYANLVSLVGRGVIDFLAVCANNSNNNNMQYRVTVDDVVIHDPLQGVAYGGYYMDNLIGGCQFSSDGSGSTFPIGITTSEMFFSRNFKVEMRTVAAANQMTVGFGSRFKLMG